jgi:predicted site-specific integrase-resolvase
MQTAAISRPRLLTQIEAARRLGIKPTTLQNWRWRGYPHVDYVKLGHQIRYPENAIDSFIAAHTHTQAAG